MTNNKPARETAAARAKRIKAEGFKKDQPTAKATPAPAEPTPAPAKPAAPKPAPANCGCGCGQPTVTAKARFLSGHDARFAGMVGRGETVPTDEQARLITPALQAKIDGIRQTTAKKAAAKQAREAAKAAAKAAYDKAMAAATA